MTNQEFLAAKAQLMDNFVMMMQQYHTYADLFKGLKAFDLPIGEIGPQYLAFSESLAEWVTYVEGATDSEDFKDRWASLQNWLQRKSPGRQQVV